MSDIFLSLSALNHFNRMHEIVYLLKQEQKTSCDSILILFVAFLQKQWSSSMISWSCIAEDGSVVTSEDIFLVRKFDNSVRIEKPTVLCAF